MMYGDVFVRIPNHSNRTLFEKCYQCLGYRFDKPDSMTDAKLKRQLEYHIAARQGPMTGLSSKWDYETGLLIFSPCFPHCFSLIGICRYMEKIKHQYNLFKSFNSVELILSFLFVLR